MIMSSWDVECPVCGTDMYGDGEQMATRVECPECGSILEISTQVEWDTYVEVIEEKHNDCDEEDDE